MKISIAQFKKAGWVMKNLKAVQLGFIFGSAVKESSRPPSDVDAAILLKAVAPAKILEIRLKLADGLADIFKREIDVAVLNTADPLLSFQVLKYGRCLFERKKGLKKEFQLKTLREYYEYAIRLNAYQQAYLKRMRPKSYG